MQDCRLSAVPLPKEGAVQFGCRNTAVNGYLNIAVSSGLL